MLALDVILLILTIACVVYCWVLNRRILQIQEYKKELVTMFKEFDHSIRKAQNILEDTKSITPKTEALIKTLESKTQNVVKDLYELINKADELADELETIIVSGNKIVSKIQSVDEFISQNDLQKDSKSLNMAFDLSVEPNETSVVMQELREKQRLSQQDYYEIIQRRSMSFK